MIERLLYSSFRKMNVFLIIYLTILVSFSIIWQIITIGYYSTSETSPDNMWYVGGLPDFWNLGSWDQVRIYLKLKVSTQDTEQR